MDIVLNVLQDPSLSEAKGGAKAEGLAFPEAQFVFQIEGTKHFGSIFMRHSPLEEDSSWFSKVKAGDKITFSVS